MPFVTRVVKDYTSGNIMKNEATLARDLRVVIEKLGPTFIKVRCCGAYPSVGCMFRLVCVVYPCMV